MILERGMDGLDTCRNILAIYPEQKAIIVSGLSDTDRIQAAQALRSEAYFCVRHDNEGCRASGMRRIHSVDGLFHQPARY
jgi:DNA-binding NarL/FixJ family response regulator